MNEQEMQFADPDWKPTGPLTVPQENIVAGASLPEPAKNPAYGASLNASMPLYKQGYRGSLQESSSYIAPVAQQMPYQSMKAVPRRSRWWLWVLIAFLVISMSGAMSHSFERGGYGFGPSFRKPAPGFGEQTYDLKDASQVSISDPYGAITVQVGNGNSVAVQADDGSQPDVSYQGQNMVITSQGSGDITVIVPQSVALNLSTGSTAIEVDGFSGQLSVQTDSGTITLNGDSLSEQSTIKTNSGNINLDQGSVNGNATISAETGTITLDQENLSGQVALSTGGNGNIEFTGTLDAQGKYQFTTDSGSIDLTLPGNTSMQMTVTQKAGAYQSDFPKSTGNLPQAAVTVTTNSGDIGIHKQ